MKRLQQDESGLTLVEMMVATMMSVIIVGAACAMLISAVRDQPGLSRKAQNVTTARYQLERVVRELRNGVKLETTTPSELAMVTRVHRVSCGGAVQRNPSAEPVQCRVVYRCSGTSCTRTEATLTGTPVGSAIVALSGLGSTSVFCFVPSREEDPSQCGEPQQGEGASIPTYVGVDLEVLNPEGPGLLTISDGATLRSSTFN
jgi:hypothetical protein